MLQHIIRNLNLLYYIENNTGFIKLQSTNVLKIKLVRKINKLFMVTLFGGFYKKKTIYKEITNCHL